METVHVLRGEPLFLLAWRADGRQDKRKVSWEKQSVFVSRHAVE
jgi:hypothetical protein